MESRENVGKEAKKEVLIIIPAYNEEKTSFRFLEKTGTAGDSAGCRCTGYG